MAKQKLSDLNLKDKIVYVGRTAKVVKGGRRFNFSAIVIVGDEEGHVGFGLGKAGEVSDAVTKATDAAKKSVVKVRARSWSSRPSTLTSSRDRIGGRPSLTIAARLPSASWHHWPITSPAGPLASSSSPES